MRRSRPVLLATLRDGRRSDRAGWSARSGRTCAVAVADAADGLCLAMWVVFVVPMLVLLLPLLMQRVESVLVPPGRLRPARSTGAER